MPGSHSSSASTSAASSSACSFPKPSPRKSKELQSLTPTEDASSEPSSEFVRDDAFQSDSASAREDFGEDRLDDAAVEAGPEPSLELRSVLHILPETWVVPTHRAQGASESDWKGAKMRNEGNPRSHSGTHEPDPEGMRFVEVDMSADDNFELSPEQS
jgi:hypothetical protein